MANPSIDFHILPKVKIKLKIGLKIYKFQKWDFSNLGLTSIPEQLIELLNMNGDFHGLLDFSHNQLKSIPEELNLGVTRGIDLSHNHLTHLPSDLLKNRIIYLNLSHNKFNQVPIQVIKNSYNLIELNMSHNFINNITINQSQILLEIDTVNFDRNIFEGKYEDKERAGLRIGVLDREKAQISKFKFKEIVGREGQSTLKNHMLSRNWDLEFHENKDRFYVKFFEILSLERFEHYDDLDATSKQNSVKKLQPSNDSRIFWQRMERLRYKFRDIRVGHSTFSNFYILYLTNQKRIKQFEEWLNIAFEGCLI